MKKPILLIMAAGMGSRFGGPKQIEPIDEHDHVILDFSVYDAIRAGFEKVVVIIKKEMEADFEERVGRRIRPHVQFEYAFQSLDKLPAGYAIPEGRVKPWGTAHAILCAKDLIDAPFAVLNADDFYGADAYRKIYAFLRKSVRNASAPWLAISWATRCPISGRSRAACARSAATESSSRSPSG